MTRKRVTTQQRQRVKQRAGGLCEYCQSQEAFATESFSIEHIIPVIEGGETVLENLALACQGCNSHKYTKTRAIDSVSEQLVSLYHPRTQKWEAHFRWSEDFLEILGITPPGRVTVIALKLNRPNLINLRRALYTIGEHPPKK